IPLKLHELYLRADLCIAGEITRVLDDTIEVQVFEHGFGAPHDPSITVRRFRNWTCASRWSPNEVGQRCLYFLAAPEDGGPWRILSGGGEGEMPLTRDRVQLRAEPEAIDVLGGAAPLCDTVIAEGRRYRDAFRQSPEGVWVEPRLHEA